MFSRKYVMRLFWPVFIEQTSAALLAFLAMRMVREVSEDAMAGVGLVGILNFLVMNAFSAVGAGVAVIVSQNIGRGDMKTAGKSATQSLVLALYLSVLVGGLMTLLARPILQGLYGSVLPGVLDAAYIYFSYSCASMPFLALFTILSSIVRATGNSMPSMVCSMASNAVYALVAWLCIYQMGTGVSGAGWAMVISRLVPAVLMCLVVLRGRGGIYLSRLSPKLDMTILRPVLKVAIPSGVDSLIFNGGKLIVNVFMAGMSPAVPVANSIANNIITVVNVPGTTVQIISVTLAGQAYGKGDVRETRRQMRLMTLLGMGVMAVSCLICLMILNPVVNLFRPSGEVYDIARAVSMLCLIFTPLFWSPSFVTPQTLRATGSAVYTMTISIISMCVVRVAGAWFFGVFLGMDLMGIWIAMILDWALRGILFLPKMLRYGRAGPPVPAQPPDGGLE